MNIDERSAVVDTDFLNHIAEINRSKEDIVRIVNTIFVAISYSAVIHPLVYEHEIIKGIEKLDILFTQEVIKRPTFEDVFLGDRGKQDYYAYLVPELYKKLTGEILDTGKQDVFTYWKRGMSLGEIHSVTMCLICECSVFLSDDSDSKKLKQIVEESVSGHINLYCRKELISAFDEQLRQVLTKDERRAFKHK